jgi:hypothetical protein
MNLYFSLSRSLEIPSFETISPKNLQSPSGSCPSHTIGPQMLEDLTIHLKWL